MAFGSAQPASRLEDPHLLRGEGAFLDDRRFDGELAAVILRSPHAHARILSIDAAAALALPGVRAVLTGADFAHLPGLPVLARPTNRDGSEAWLPDRPLIAIDRVRYVGEAVALVIAESRTVAADAAGLVAVDYADLPQVTDAREAILPGAPASDGDRPDNLSFDWAIGDETATEVAFAAAAHVIALEATNNRLVGFSMEPRGAVGLHHRASGRYTLHTSCQGVIRLHRLISERILKIPHERLRVVCPEVGGGFGIKASVYPEQVLVLAAAERLGRPVRWIADRSESFLTDNHARDNWSRAELALDAEGRFLGVRQYTVTNLGAQLSTMAPYIPTEGALRVAGGPYRLPCYHARVIGAFTNTTPVDAYRGAGRPETTYLLERLIDQAALALGLDRVELRRRNLLTPGDLPYRTPVGGQIGSGDFARVVDEAVAAADWQGFAARRDAAAARGRIAGIGLACYIDSTGGQADEEAELVFTPDGVLEITVGTQSNGQGHDTIFRRIAAERLGLDPSAIRILQGDTDRVRHGGGTAGSRTAQMGGSAVAEGARALLRSAEAAAAIVLEAAAADLEFDRGSFRIAGTDRSVTLNELARASHAGIPEIPAGLLTTLRYKRDANAIPYGCHVAEVEIDPETGRLVLTRYTAVDDFGSLLDRSIVVGQMHGGIAQGIGQALLEGVVYDRGSGQLLTGSAMDYCLPRADDLPDFALSFVEIPCPTNPAGAKGCGEAGTIAAPPALVNAALDALRPLGVAHLDMPLTPERIWTAIEAAKPHSPPRHEDTKKIKNNSVS